MAQQTVNRFAIFGASETLRLPFGLGRHDDCERLLANIRELIAGPPMGSLGDDEDEAEKQTSAREPKVQRGAAAGTRGRKDAKPLIEIANIAPNLRSDEI